MRRSPILPRLLLLLCAATPNQAARAQTGPDSSLIGEWSGPVSYAGETMHVGLRFKTVRDTLTGMSMDIPEMKLQDVGPFKVDRQPDGQYSSYIFTFAMSPDGKNLSVRWSFDGHDLAFTVERGVSPPARAKAPEGAGRVATPRWTFKTGGAIWSSPAVAEGTVYVGSNDGSVYAVTADSGKAVWRFETGGAVPARPTPAGEFLYVPSDDGYLYKLSRATGKEIWRFDTHGGSVKRILPDPRDGTYDFLASAAVIDGATIYVGSADGRLYAIDAGTGHERWHVETGGMVRSTPAVAGGHVFFGSWDHNVYAVDARTGAVVWKRDTLREIQSSPLVAGGTVFVGSRCSDLFALDAATGEIKWKYFYWSSWVESSARLRDGTLYVGSSDLQQLFAIDALTGRRAWAFDTDGSAWSTPAVTENRVYIGAAGVLDYYLIQHHGGFFAVDRATGKVAWRYSFTPVPGSPVYGVASSPAVAGRLVFFGALDGMLYAFPVDG